MRILALDVGERRIGVAISDPTEAIAGSVGVIQRTGLEADLQQVVKVADLRRAEAIVVGNPIGLSGIAGHQSERVQRFAEALRGATALPVVLWDERLSTVAAHRRLAEAGHRGRRRSGRIDAAAAAVVLEGYLEFRRGQQR